MQNTKSVDPITIFAQQLILSVSYFLVGYLSFTLTSASNHIVAFFPSAGIAVASLLIFGRYLWPGVFLGSFFLNLVIGVDNGVVTGTALLLAAGVAFGAVLQALAGYALVKWTLPKELSLAKERDIFIFMLLTGPVASIVNATIGNLCLLASGIISASNLWQSWVLWWMGDALGVTVTLPVLFTLFAKPKALWISRRVVVIIPLLFMFMITLGLFNWSKAWEAERNHFQFTEMTNNTVERLNASFASYVDSVASIERLFASSSEVTRDDFRTFLEYVLQNKPGINGLSWNPVVSGDERLSFEQEVRNQGFTDFEIKQRVQGKLVRAQDRDEYIAVNYIEPLAENNKALGFDVASNTSRKIALASARDTGLPIATARIDLVQEKASQSGFLLFYPIYREISESLRQRRENITGYAVGVFRVGDIVESVLAGQYQDKFILGIYDTEDGSALYGPPDPSQLSQSALSVVESLSIGGRQWELHFLPSETFLAQQVFWQTPLVLGLGLLVTTLLGIFLLGMTGRSFDLEQQIKERTRALLAHEIELQETNAVLQQSNLLLERSNQELDQYAFVASHDLKSPLQAIEKLGNWISEDCSNILPEDSKRHLALLKERIVRMQTLLADLLTFARLSRDEYEKEEINLQSLIEKTFSFCVDRGAFRLMVEGCNTHVLLPRIPIELALRNLIGNAIKHHDQQQGVVVVSYVKQNNEHLLTVKDDGPGIPPELQSVAMDMFSTLKPRDEVEGSGLGLSLVKKAMERLEGQVVIISDGQRGSVIELRWPEKRIIERVA